MANLWTNTGYQAAAVIYAVFATITIGRGARTTSARFFLAALAATAFWAQLFVLANLGLVGPIAFNLVVAARDGAWLGFTLALMRPLSTDRLYWRIATGAASALIALQVVLYSVSGLFGAVAGVRIDVNLIRVCTTILCFVLIENVLRNASRAGFWAVKHWAIGYSAILAFQLVVRIPEFLTHKPNLGTNLAAPLVALIALPFFVISSVRLPQLNLRIHSSRSFVFHTATVFAVAILLQGTAFAAWYVRSYGGSNGTALAVTVGFSGVVAIAAALVSGTIRSHIRLLINQHFFSFKYDYRVEWERAIRGLTSEPAKNVGERALRVLCDLMDTSGGAIWLYRESWCQFVQLEKIGTAAHVGALRENDERVELVRKDDRPFVHLSAESSGDATFCAFRSFIDNAWLLLPLRYHSNLTGFVVLNKPRVARKLDWEDENLVRVLALQVSAYLVQEEMAQSLADARQLEDFNKRFAFVVHDIKNTIGQLSLLVRNVAKFGDQKEFRDDMVITLVNSVDRLEALLKSLALVGSNAPSGRRQVVDLTQILNTFAEAKSALGYIIRLHQPPSSALVNIDSVALLRVLEHVVSNAVEAAEPSAPVEITLVANGDKFELAVADRGTGMTQQFINEELFRPLRSTKSGGFGVGAYQIRELMRELGGDVAVESEVGRGTRVILTLPRHAALVDL